MVIVYLPLRNIVNHCRTWFLPGTTKKTKHIKFDFVTANETIVRWHYPKDQQMALNNLICCIWAKNISFKYLIVFIWGQHLILSLVSEGTQRNPLESVKQMKHFTHFYQRSSTLYSKPSLPPSLCSHDIHCVMIVLQVRKEQGGCLPHT